MKLDATAPSEYLGSDAIVETDHPEIRGLAASLRAAATDDGDFARRAFEWVRDEVRHSVDAQDPRVTLTATEVLNHRVGLCFAKSHLLAAVLRAGSVPAGLCYQRFVEDGRAFLHGLVAFHLDGAWHRVDPRGNKPGVDAQFSLGDERLAWKVDPAQSEQDLPTVHVQPAKTVVDALTAADDALHLCASGLPSST